jgi:hypothetical protein
MNCHDCIVMWSSVVLFVLTFAVFGLLLGFAAVYDTNQEGQMGDGAAVIRQNVSESENDTQGGQSGSPDANEQSGQ